MAKKPPKETPHLRVRIEPRLLTKLEKSRDKNGHTLTGEIVARLEQTFDADETTVALRNQLNDLRQLFEPLLAQAENSKKELAEISGKLEASKETIKDIRREAQIIEASAKMVDVLLGEDKLKAALLRRLALEIASWPQDWSTNPSIRNEIEQRFRSTFASQIGEDVQ